MVRIILHGCNGAMGQVITGLAASDADLKIVAGIDLRGKKLNDYPVFTSPQACDVEADVVIDFSTAKAVDGILAYAADKKLPLVLCTTGLSEEQLEAVAAQSEKTAVLRSANMSLGVNTVFKLAAMAAEILAGAGYDMEIIEKHHNKKLDAPSGTALAIADAINAAMKGTYTYTLDRSSERRPRDTHEIGIQSVRGGTIVGEHEVLYCGPDEVIEIKHTAYSKGIFAKGALSAAKFMAGKTEGMYDMSHVIG